MDANIQSAEADNQSKKIKKEAERQRRIKVMNISSIIIVLAALGWGVMVFFHFNDSAYTDDAQVDAYINPVNVRVQGFIKEIRFTEHQQVHKGDTLALIEDAEYRLKVDEAKSQLADAQAERKVLMAGVELSSNGIHVSDANVEELRARLENLEANYKRYEHLLAADVVSPYQFDLIKTDLNATRAKYKALKAQTVNSQLSNRETTERIPLNDAKLQKAQDAVKLAELNLSYTVVRAPYDGVLGRKVVEYGQLMQPGQPLVSILRDGKKWITANYTESQMKHIKMGMPIKIKIDAIPDKVFDGKVSAISEATGSRYSAVPVDNSTGNFIKVQQRIPVRIDFERHGEDDATIANLLVGMNATLKAR